MGHLGLPPPSPGTLATGPELPTGEGEVTAASSGPVLWGGLGWASPHPQPAKLFSGLFLPFRPAEPGLL